jgi:hypothetical protein
VQWLSFGGPSTSWVVHGLARPCSEPPVDWAVQETGRSGLAIFWTAHRQACAGIWLCWSGHGVPWPWAGDFLCWSGDGLVWKWGELEIVCSGYGSDIAWDDHCLGPAVGWDYHWMVRGWARRLCAAIAWAGNGIGLTGHGLSWAG